MSLITCTDDCVYQEEGYCRLEQAASGGQMSTAAGCVHYVGRGAHGGTAMGMQSAEYRMQK